MFLNLLPVNRGAKKRVSVMDKVKRLKRQELQIVCANYEHETGMANSPLNCLEDGAVNETLPKTLKTSHTSEVFH